MLGEEYLPAHVAKGTLNNSLFLRLAQTTLPLLPPIVAKLLPHLTLGLF